MRQVINEKWKEATRREIANSTKSEWVVSFSPAATWLVSYLANQQIPCKVVNLGAGVKRIIIGEVCPSCKGTGLK